jgi:broad specificity phosphatase PhoE
MMAKRNDTIDRATFEKSGREGGRKSWEGLTAAERKKRLAKLHGGWKNMTKAERSKEMKRRAKVRAANKIKKEV